jgi:hypothetical protein
LRFPTSTSTRRLALTITALALLAAALLGPTQSLALAHKTSCSAASARVTTKHAGRSCTRNGHKRKHHHASRRDGKHLPAETPAAAAQNPPAACEDGSAPLRASDGSFSCADGSEPECEDGTIPTRSSNGKRLLCPILNADETEPGEEAECEEGFSLTCSAGTSVYPNEHGCEEPSSASTNFACEAES